MATYSSVRVMELLCSYAQRPSLALRNQLVLLNQGLVRQVAHRLSRQCAEPYEDLEQVGYLGLIRAIERFDPRQGKAFSSFAMPYIRGEILHHLRDKGTVLRIPRRWQELHTKGKALQRQLTGQLGRSPQPEEMAAGLAVSLAEWQECQRIYQKAFVVSLDGTLSASSADSCLAFLDTLPDRQEQDQRVWEEECLQVQGAIAQLEGKTKAAIEYVYLQELPRKQAARVIGISPMTVTRHLQKGLKELGQLLQPQVA